MIAKPGIETEWEQNGWECVLRFKDDKVREAIGECASRLVLRTKEGADVEEAHRVLKEKEYNIGRVRKLLQTGDAEFVILSCLCAGILDLEYSATAPSYIAMMNRFPSVGFKRIKNIDYLKSALLLKNGDILIKNGSTVVFVK